MTVIADLIKEGARWHSIAQNALLNDDQTQAAVAYHRRESIARYTAAHTSTMTFAQVRARIILTARTLDLSPV